MTLVTVTTAAIPGINEFKEVLRPSEHDYTETPNSFSFKKRQSTAEGTIWLKVEITCFKEEEGPYFSITGPGIEYNGYDKEEALTKTEVAKSLFDQN